MSDKQRLWLEKGGLLVAVLLPLAFNPFAERDFFEPVKVFLFRGIVFMMGVVAILPLLVRQRNTEFHREPQSFTEKTREKLPGAERLLQKNPLVLPVLVYGVVYLWATAVSINPTVSLWGRGNRHGTITVLAVILFFLLLTIALREWSQIERMITAVILGSVPVAFYGYIQYFGLDRLAWVGDSVSPVHSTLGRSLYLGAYLAMVIPFTVARIINQREKRPFAYSIILFIQLGCLMVTLARGAWLGFLGGMLLFFTLLTYHNRNWIPGFFLLVLIGGALFAFITLKGSNLFLETARVPTTEQLSKIRLGSNKTRTVTWRNALEMVPEKWLLGYGPETYPVMMEQASSAGLLSEPDWVLMNDPHNLVLYQLTAVGVVGLLTFLWIVTQFYHSVFTFFRQIAHPDKKATIAAIISSTTAYLILAQFNPDVMTLTVFLWINFSLGVTILKTAVVASK